MSEDRKNFTTGSGSTFKYLENYMVGNGTICASGVGNGQWDFIAGPDYTCPNLIEKEKLAIVIDGVEQSLEPEMFRVRETGNFSGTTQIRDVKITLFDYSVSGSSMVSRLVIVNNNASKSHSLQLKAYLTPIINKGEKVIEPGGFEILIGSSSADIRMKKMFTYK